MIFNISSVILKVTALVKYLMMYVRGEFSMVSILFTQVNAERDVVEREACHQEVLESRMCV
jgi:hypothetical protein